jgi:hypothetical protein
VDLRLSKSEIEKFKKSKTKVKKEDDESYSPPVPRTASLELSPVPVRRRSLRNSVKYIYNNDDIEEEFAKIYPLPSKSVKPSGLRG